MAYRKLKKLGYRLDSEWLKYKNNQGSDFIMISPEGKIVFVEVKGGVNVHGPGNLGKITIKNRTGKIIGEVRQGDIKYLTNRVQKGIDRAKNTNDYEAVNHLNSLLDGITRGNIESLGVFVNTKGGQVKMYDIVNENNYIEIERTSIKDILDIKVDNNGHK